MCQCCVDQGGGQIEVIGGPGGRRRSGKGRAGSFRRSIIPDDVVGRQVPLLRSQVEYFSRHGRDTSPIQNSVLAPAVSTSDLRTHSSFPSSRIRNTAKLAGSHALALPQTERVLVGRNKDPAPVVESKRTRRHPPGVDILNQSRLAGLMVDRVCRDAILSAGLENLAGGTAGPVRLIHKPSVGVDVHRPCCRPGRTVCGSAGLSLTNSGSSLSVPSFSFS